MNKPFASLTKDKVKRLADGNAIFVRGKDYFDRGAVERIWLEDNRIFAKVLGRCEEYEVTVEDDDGKFSCQCTCPYDGYNCKHTVAVCLAFLDTQDEIVKTAKQKENQQNDLGEQLIRLDKKDLVGLLLLSFKTHKNWKNTLLKQLAKRFKEQGVEEVNKQIYEEQFSNHFTRVCDILQDFNEYGGGPYEEEDEACEELTEIVKLFKTGKLSAELKREFIDKMFYYYDWGNSGLIDMLMDSIFECASSTDDWKYIIGKLQAKEGKYGSYRQELIMQIYKDHLKDDEQYLKMRYQDLQHARDYFDLVQYWHGKKKIDKAVEVAKEGINKFDCNVSDLVEYLFAHYKSKDYGVALGYLKRLFEERQNLEYYKRLKKFAQERDWEHIDQWCRELLTKENSTHELAKIQRYNKEYDNVLAYVLDGTEDTQFWDDGQKVLFAHELIDKYPAELIPFYEKRVQQHIDRMGRKDYQKAAEFAQKLKEIYTKHLDQKEIWQNFVDEIRSTYANRKALLDELKHV